ncbi:diphthine synthase [Trichuris trichiura]|uniref:GPI alpha-1,4-mannosyltransferase I, catalytic subunit n=1 Tax=Trichuris trichiura TaxID=36087 RepID=A0A077Z758_TRITR|nr:diphthine synthase [Trichuris trichiura]
MFIEMADPFATRKPTRLFEQRYPKLREVLQSSEICSTDVGFSWLAKFMNSPNAESFGGQPDWRKLPQATTMYNNSMSRDGQSKMTDSTIYRGKRDCLDRIGIYGWRKRCLYAMILLLVVLIVANISLTFWIMSVLGFSLQGIGGLRISKDKLVVTGHAEFVNTVYLQKLSSPEKTPLMVESNRGVRLTARDQTGNVSSRLILNDGKVQALCDRFDVVNKEGKTVFSALEDEVAVRVENLRIISEGGSVFEGSIQTSIIRPEQDAPLLLESPTRGMDVDVAQDIEILSRAGDFKAEALHNILLESAAGEIALSSRKVYVDRLSRGSERGHMHDIQDRFMEVKFTDVDYVVMTDAARLVASGQSPFGRPTYRYTPLFAWLLLPANRWLCFGKMLFNCFDLLTGWLCVQLAGRYDAFIWYLALLNPFTMIISSRGNAEPLLTCLTLLALFLFVRKRQRAWLGAAVLGAAIHVKLYPIIYIPSVFCHQFLKGLKKRNATSYRRSFVLNAFVRSVLTVFLACCVFLALTTLCYICYGEAYLNEALLYHVGRTDIRHNFSAYFFPLYLLGEEEALLLKTLLSYSAFVLQFMLIAAIAIVYAENDLEFCWFLTTYSFVTFNKVCTSQYFVWYLTFLPVVSGRLSLSTSMAIRMSLIWLFAQAQWLLPAYLLEFHGFNVYLWLWLASVIFHSVNVSIMCTLVVAYNLMLYLIGLGLGGPDDLTLRGLRAGQRCSKLYFEMYTSLLPDGQDMSQLELHFGKEILPCDRELLESGCGKVSNDFGRSRNFFLIEEQIIEEAKNEDVGILVVGDPLGATTHCSLYLQAKEYHIPVEVIHNASVLSAIGCCGLQLYNFGKTVSIVFWTAEYKPESFFDQIEVNLKNGFHTLCLLDLKVKERSVENIIRDRKIYEPPRFMLANEAARILMDIWERRRKMGNPTVLQSTTRCVGLARIGWHSQQIVCRSLKDMCHVNLGPPLHSVAIVGETHELEDSMLSLWE